MSYTCLVSIARVITVIALFIYFTVFANIVQLMSNHFIIYYSMHIDRYCQPKTFTRVVGLQPNLHYVVELLQLLHFQSLNNDILRPTICNLKCEQEMILCF